MFVWSLTILFEPLVHAGSLYLVYVLINNKDISFKMKLVISALYVPLIILVPIGYTLSSFDLTICLAKENIFAYYPYFIETIFTIWIIIFGIKKYRQAVNKNKKKEIFYLIIGTILFIVAFSWGAITGSFTEDWNIAQWGLIGMPIFIIFLAYGIIKFRIFNIKLLATQALVWGLVLLIGSQFFFVKTLINKILTAVTLLFSCVGGYMLVRSVKKEVHQREQLATLNLDLQNSIKQRESLVHLVTHKVKGSFTRSKYIFAEILEGTFGPISDKIKDIAQQGLNSDNEGISTVDLVLNVANLQGGKVKYDMKPLDFKNILEEIVKEKTPQAKFKNLKLNLKIKIGDYIINGDSFWLKEAARNLVDNSIKYTLTGSVNVGLDRKNENILMSVKDTGVGISEEDRVNLFKEGGRGKESIRINVDSTGYGLYTVKMVVEAHQGRVWVESEGKNKGSAFYLELPAETKRKI